MNLKLGQYLFLYTEIRPNTGMIVKAPVVEIGDKTFVVHELSPHTFIDFGTHGVERLRPKDKDGNPIFTKDGEEVIIDGAEAYISKEKIIQAVDRRNKARIRYKSKRPIITKWLYFEYPLEWVLSELKDKKNDETRAYSSGATDT